MFFQRQYLISWRELISSDSDVDRMAILSISDISRGATMKWHNCHVASRHIVTSCDQVFCAREEILKEAEDRL